MYKKLVIIFVIFIMILQFKENFSNMDAIRYYSPRTFSHDEYDVKRKLGYPYNYKPYEYYQRFNYYPSDLDYGYGHW